MAKPFETAVPERPCPTCRTPMADFGGYEFDLFYWCPECGTHQADTQEVGKPATTRTRVPRWNEKPPGRPPDLGPAEATPVHADETNAGGPAAPAEWTCMLGDPADAKRPPIAVRVRLSDDGRRIEIAAQGYGVPGEPDGEGRPIVVEYTRGGLRVRVHTDINDSTRRRTTALLHAHEKRRRKPDRNS